MFLRLLMTAFTLVTTPAAAQPEILQSGAHDLIGAQYTDGPLDDAVLVCLKNRSTSGVQKALRNHADGFARILLPDPGLGCVAFVPTRHVFYFEKQPGRQPVTVLSVPVDLSLRAGKTLTFDWLRDSAP
ncbi:hypothetical protein [Fluviibacterium sp. S390]|uniref:hypothetical protein n=1 Tax=Fluviibacterium sp. S390 TaxID=3415139 RepID=UPI003C7AC640